MGGVFPRRQIVKLHRQQRGTPCLGPQHVTRTAEARRTQRLNTRFGILAGWTDARIGKLGWQPQALADRRHRWPHGFEPGPSGVPAEHRFFDVVFSPDGEFLATNGPAGSVLVWNIQQRKVVRQFPGHGSTVWYLAFSGEGQLASGGCDGKVWLWNFATGEGRELSGHEPGVTCVSFSPDGKTLISGGEDNLIKLWDVATGELKSTLRGHTHQVYTVVSSPDGAMLASASRDGTVRFWSMETRHEVAALRGFGGHVKDVAFSPDGHTLAAVGEDGYVKLWDVAAVTRNAMIEGTPVGYLTRDDEIVVWNRGRLEIRDPTTLELTSDPSNSLTNCVGRSPDGKYAALRHPEGTVDVLCVATGERRELPIWKENCADSVEFSADNKYIASTKRLGSSYRHRLNLWDWSNSVELLDCEFEWSKPAFSPGWELIAAYCTEGGDRVVKLWNRTGTEMARIPQPKPVFSLAFSADRSTLAVGTWRGTIEFWNVSSPERPFHLKSLAGHVGPVEAVDFGPHGRRLASGGRDRTVKLWDIATGDEMISLKGHRRRVTSVAFLPNGKTLVSCSEDERVVRFCARRAKRK